MIILKLFFAFAVAFVIFGVASLFLFIRSFVKMKKQFDNLGKQQNSTEVRQTKYRQKKQIFDNDEGEYIDFEEEE